ncbi:MAG: NYN domain-containing protein [Candidatus Brennerbacteria bacterium]|nr:NYN domain-containing protein [Candidatus Brennerbacteria bacterium]
MDLQELKRNYYLFDPKEYGRIFVFVDFSNVRYWAKSFWPKENKNYLKREIDIHKLAEVINFIKPEEKFFYYGHYKQYPDLPSENAFNIKYRQSIYRIDKARKFGFRVRTKAIKEIDNFDDEGKFLGRIRKCNFDIEMTMDMLIKIEKYNTVFLWFGDSDFHHLLQHLKSKKKKIITICGRDFASEELRNNSDLFIPADPLKELLEYIPNKKALPT